MYDCLLPNIYFAAATTEVEGLKAALEKAKAEAVAEKEATVKAMEDIEKAKLAGEKHKARVAKVQVELNDAIKKFEVLEKEQEERSSKLSNEEKELQEARIEARGVREVLCQVGQIADGKKYLLQSMFGGNRFALLTCVWRSPSVFAELLKSAVAAAEHHAMWKEDLKRWLF